MAVKLKGDEKSVEEAMADQVGAENSAGRIEATNLYTKNSSAPKRNVPLNSDKKSKSLKIIIIVSIAVLIFLVLLITFILYFLGRERVIKIDNQLGEATFNNGKTCLINLSESIILSKVETMNFGFYDKKGNKYNYTAPGISKEYKLDTSSIGLKSFDKITRVNLIIKYKAKESDKSAPLTNQTNTTNQTNGTNITCNDTCTSLGKKCGNWTICNKTAYCGNCSTGSCNETGQCVVPSCINSTGCSKEGLFCNGNLRYNCTYVGVCLNKTNLTACSSGEQCINGTCAVIYLPQCTNNKNCTSLVNDCSYGICNSTEKCEMKFNSSATVCRPSAGECDAAEKCTGNSAACQTDTFNSSATVCRPSAGECDAAENCDGASKTCPTDLNKADGVPCSLGTCSSGNCIECLADNDCSPDKCYTSEYRDYFCNSFKVCKYNDMTEEENTGNGNCEDSINNDCDSLTDWQDEGCIASRVCGNGKLEGQQCDDGNTNLGDGCSPTCTIEYGRRCSGEPSHCEMGFPSMSPFVRFWSWIKDIF